MSKMVKSQSELLHLQTNAAEANKANSSENEELVQRVEIEGTPFYRVKLHDKPGWFVALGRYSLTTPDLEAEEAERLVREKDWTLLFNVMRLIAGDEILINEEVKKGNMSKENIVVRG